MRELEGKGGNALEVIVVQDIGVLISQIAWKSFSPRGCVTTAHGFSRAYLRFLSVFQVLSLLTLFYAPAPLSCAFEAGSTSCENMAFLWKGLWVPWDLSLQ